MTKRLFEFSHFRVNHIATIHLFTMLVIIILVFFFRRIERYFRNYFSDNWAIEGRLLQGFNGALCCDFLCFVYIKNSRSVLGTSVISLTV